MIDNQYIVTICAFGFSLISTGMILFLSRLTNVSAEGIILSGVVMGSIFSAALTGLQFFATDVQLASIVYWTFGDLSRVTWDSLALLFIVSLPVFLFFYITVGLTMRLMLVWIQLGV